MNQRASAPTLQRFRTLVRAAAALCLVLHLGGASSLLVQSAAWLQMAKGAGGLRHLAWAVSEAPPCRVCEMARALTGEPAGETGVPVPRERLDFLRLVLAAENPFQLRRDEGIPAFEAFPPPSSERAAGSRADRPPVPPPRAARA